VKEGQTGKDGEVEAWIPADTRSATLLLRHDDAGYVERINLNVGRLDPHSEITGVQSRLLNLGYFRGPVDGVIGPQTRQALRGYQKAMNLDETGEADEATCQKLSEGHGS
jgi:peptidoglycan hydrolase-like protein with peptidoglycan-binding domain